MQLVIGRIGRAHGVRGDLFVEPMTDEPDHRYADGTVLMTSDNTTLTVATSKWHSGRFVVHFAGVDDRTAAEALRGQTLTINVDPTELPEDPDEYYDHQLVGLNVALEDGSVIGVIGEVIHLPSQDLLSVKREGDTEVLIPFVMEFVPEIDLDTKTVTITPPPGLLDELDAIVVRDEGALMLKFDVITVFPDYLKPLQLSLMGKAIDDGLLSVNVKDLRDYTTDKHQSVDDSPYGGGPGMVMKPEPWGDALDEFTSAETILIIPTPSGKPFTQALATELSTAQHIVFACGRYEGIDSRVAEHYKTKFRVEEVSIGDYVLAGGEVAVLVMVEAIARLVPGVLGNQESFADDSFAVGAMENLLEGPVYTRPPVWRDLEVPAVLTSGDHAKILAWKLEQAKLRTSQNRPDLSE